MARKPIQCPKCNKLYSGQGKQCMDCFQKQQAEKGEKSKTCPLCGKEKHRQSSICRACSIAHVSKPENYVTKPCPVCEKVFTVHVVHINRGAGIYCSKHCAGSRRPARKRTRLTVNCWTCGKHFEKHKSEIKKNVGDKHFCSPVCWYIYNQGENHAEWQGGTPDRQRLYSSKEWKAAALLVWKRDNGHCQRCGVRKESYRKPFHIHHIVSFVSDESLRAEPSNLILLCEKCHKWVHSLKNVNKEFICESSNNIHAKRADTIAPTQIL